MDSFVNAGKKFLQESLQEGHNPLPGGNKAHGGNYPAGGGFHADDDLAGAHEEAARRAGSSGSADFFSGIVGAISEKKGRLADEDIDEQDAIRKHKMAYEEDHRADESSIGTAAAMQALKKFAGGEPSQPQGQGAFIALALSEASKLFDDKASQGKVPSGASKESAVQQAGEFAMKMYLKSHGQQQGGLAGLAAKFLK